MPVGALQAVRDLVCLWQVYEKVRLTRKKPNFN